MLKQLEVELRVECDRRPIRRCVEACVVAIYHNMAFIMLKLKFFHQLWFLYSFFSFLKKYETVNMPSIHYIPARLNVVLFRYVESTGSGQNSSKNLICEELN